MMLKAFTAVVVVLVGVGLLLIVTSLLLGVILLVKVAIAH